MFFLRNDDGIESGCYEISNGDEELSSRKGNGVVRCYLASGEFNSTKNHWQGEIGLSASFEI